MAAGEIMVIEGEEFRRLQLLELDMIAEVDRVCRKHNITYSMCGGTLLGAIRHKGFIPWDDDADLWMLREDYERFRKVANEMDPEICWLQDHETDPEYPWGYSKIRRTGTTFIRIGQEHLKMKTGVMIDLFPLDDCPKSRFGQWLQDIYCFCLRKINYAEVGRLNMEYSAPMRAWFTLLSKIPKQWVFDRVWGMAKHSRNDSPNLVRNLLFPAGCQMYPEAQPEPENWYGMPKKWVVDVVEYEFEGHMFYGARDYEGFLKWMYGDWRKLPPEDKRDPHGPVSYYEF